MARKIIITNKRPSTSDIHHYEFVFWLTVPVSRRPFYANPTFESALMGTSDAPSNPELTDLRNGTIKEEVHNSQWPVSVTLAEIQSNLIDFYNQRQAVVDNHNPWTRHGTFWDGATWTPKSVA